MKSIYYSDFDERLKMATTKTYDMSSRVGFMLEPKAIGLIDNIKKSQHRLFMFLVIDSEVIKTRRIVLNKNLYDRYRKAINKKENSNSPSDKSIRNDLLVLYNQGVMYRDGRGVYKFSMQYVIPANIYYRMEDVKYELEIPYREYLKSNQAKKKELHKLISN